MTTSRKVAIVIVVSSLCLLYATLSPNYSTQENYRVIHLGSTLHLSVVACGDRFEEAITMIKSVMLFSKVPIHVHIFTDETQPAAFVNESILNDVDALVYVDSDVLFLKPVEDLWSLFTKFNKSQMAAVAFEVGRKSWYTQPRSQFFPYIPYVPPAGYSLVPFEVVAKYHSSAAASSKTGINSGVLLMNLTRMRAADWLADITRYYSKYHRNLRLGDQDLLNIYFHFHPERLFQLSCVWNYRPAGCIHPRLVCKETDKHGISVLHGPGGMFHTGIQPVYTAVYGAILNHRFGNGSRNTILETLSKNINSTPRTECGDFGRFITEQLKVDLMTALYSH